MSQLTFIQLLGGLRVEQNGVVTTRFRTQKTAALLAYLACYPARSHSREELSELLWPDAGVGTGSLRTALSSLRQHLEPPGVPAGAILIIDRYHVRLNLDYVRIDLTEFETVLQAAARSQNPTERSAFLRRAVDLYQGPLLPGLYEDWALQERERVQQAFAGALGSLSLALEQADDLAGALDIAHRAVQLDPLAEEAHADLMRLYAASGQWDAALRQYDDLARILNRELRTTPSENVRALAEQIQRQRQEPSVISGTDPACSRLQTAARPASPALWRENVAPLFPMHLPLQLTRFFGREAEIEQIKAWLGEGQTRLLTLTGPGGSGKTRLAIEAARKLTPAFNGGIWFVALADISDPGFILDAVLASLQPPRPSGDALADIAQSIGERTCLFLLDNFEQLAEEGGAVVWQLLERIPSLSVLVTSRQRLELYGERELPLSPLPVPTLSGTPERLAEFPSVQLFVDRAQAVRPDFRIADTNAAKVTALCERLEGIPLAIELASASAGLLSLDQMLARLDQGLGLLASNRKDLAPRHRTLRATIDGSYRLLSPEWQRFFAELSVFHGGWTIEAAGEVCLPLLEPRSAEGLASGEAALDMLRELKARSLVVTEETGAEIRFRLLETLRAYAGEQLSSEEQAALARRHLEYYVRLAEQAEAAMSGPDQVAWLDRLEVEHENIRAALHWGRERAETLPLTLRLAGAVGPFWRVRGHWLEGRKHLEDLEQRQICADDLPARAKALYVLGTLAAARTNFAAARVWLQESLALCRSLGDRKGAANALHELGAIPIGDEPLEQRLAWIEESLEIRRQIGDRAGISTSVLHLGNLARTRGVYAEAQALYTESLGLKRELGDARGVATALNNLGVVAEEQGRYAEAESFYAEALEINRQLGDRMAISLALGNLGIVAGLRGDYAEARRLIEESLLVRWEFGENRLMSGSMEDLSRIVLAAGPEGNSGPEYLERAACLLGAAAKTRDRAGIVLWAFEQASHEEHVAKVKSALGEETYQRAWERGYRMSLDEAVGYALDKSRP